MSCPTQCPQPGLKPRPINRESSAVTMGSLYIHIPAMEPGCLLVPIFGTWYTISLNVKWGDVFLFVFWSGTDIQCLTETVTLLIPVVVNYY